MSTAHTLTRTGSNWELYHGAPYADHLVATFVEPKAKAALAIADELIGEGEWSQMTPSEYRRK